jgi:hypothetical protein
MTNGGKKEGKQQHLTRLPISVLDDCPRLTATPIAVGHA